MNNSGRCGKPMSYSISFFPLGQTDLQGLCGQNTAITAEGFDGAALEQTDLGPFSLATPLLPAWFKGGTHRQPEIPDLADEVKR